MSNLYKPLLSIFSSQIQSTHIKGNILKNTYQGMNYLNQVIGNPNTQIVLKNNKLYLLR